MAPAFYFLLWRWQHVSADPTRQLSGSADYFTETSILSIISNSSMGFLGQADIQKFFPAQHMMRLWYTYYPVHLALFPFQTKHKTVIISAF